MNNSGNLREGSNEGVDWMFPQFQVIKDTSFTFSINKTLQGCFVIGDAVGTSIRRGSADYMVLNPTLDVGSWNF